MSAGFLPNVSSCAWVWHVCICFWTKLIKTDVGRGKAKPHGRPCPTRDCRSHAAESQPLEVEQGCCLRPAGIVQEHYWAGVLPVGSSSRWQPCHHELFLRRTCGSPSAISLCVATVWLPSDVPFATSALFRPISALRLFIPEDACCFLTLWEGKLQELYCRVQCVGGTEHSVLVRRVSSSLLTFLHLQNKCCKTSPHC